MTPAVFASDLHDGTPETTELTAHVRGTLNAMATRCLVERRQLILGGDTIDVMQLGRDGFDWARPPWPAVIELAKQGLVTMLSGNHDREHKLRAMAHPALVANVRESAIVNGVLCIHGHQGSPLYGTWLHPVGEAAIRVAGWAERHYLDIDQPGRLRAKDSLVQATFVDRWAERTLADGIRSGRFEAMVHGHLHRPGLRPSGAIDAGHSTDGTARWVEIWPVARIVRCEV